MTLLLSGIDNEYIMFPVCILCHLNLGKFTLLELLLEAETLLGAKIHESL